MILRSTTPRSRVLAAAMVAATLATGCGGSPTSTPSPSPSTSTSASPSPLPTTSEGLLSPPPAVDWQRSVPYGDDPAQVIDVHVPDTSVPSPTGDPAARPAIVLVHGGGWTEGDREAYHALATGLADAGWVAATVGYRLAPGATHPAAAEDVAAALRLVVEDLDLPLDRERVALAGDSAGGHLSGLVALGDDAPPVAAWVSWSGLYDLPTVAATMADGGAGWVSARLATYLGCADATADSCAEAAAEASPVRLASPDDPPTLLLHSRNEIVPLSDARAMRRALAEAGVRVRLEVYDGRRHGQALLAPSQDVVRDFLVDVLGLAG